MARLVSLNVRVPVRGVQMLAAALAATAGIFGAWSAARADQPKPPATNAPPVAKAPAPASTAPVAPTNVAPTSTLGQYGKIFSAGDQPAHPLKLKMPFPDAGEVKIPGADEMVMRDKLEALAALSDADIRAQLDKWPAYGKMNLRDQGVMLQRIQDFRDYRANVARQKAHEMGLLTLTPDQFPKFEKEFWDKRLQMDNDLAKQFTPIYHAREQKMLDELYREFSVVSPGPIAQAPPKPPAPTPPKPVAPAPPAKPVATAPMTNSVTMPVAQGPR